ncbi:hypothetical protein CI102_8034 [Trichoderma harzianum]|nr:hypothetical protein CI102_8034 [Trichoderma harzianum]
MQALARYLLYASAAALGRGTASSCPSSALPPNLLPSDAFHNCLESFHSNCCAPVQPYLFTSLLSLASTIFPIHQLSSALPISLWLRR